MLMLRNFPRNSCVPDTRVPWGNGLGLNERLERGIGHLE
jgi:hypothetical protein